MEDNCDAFGSKFNNQLTGTFGDVSTLSFIPHTILQQVKVGQFVPINQN